MLEGYRQLKGYLSHNSFQITTPTIMNKSMESMVQINMMHDLTIIERRGRSHKFHKGADITIKPITNLSFINHNTTSKF